MLQRIAVVLTVLTLFGCGPGLEPGDDALRQEDTTATESVDEAGQVEQSVTYNACACLDPSRVMDCGTGSTCTGYRQTSTRDSYYCQKDNRSFTCPHYAAYQCRKTNYQPNGLPCCSGRAAYVGSLLLCQ
ncbi:hypothetical protein ACQKGO_27620 [Corallococcus interemptor]|uniref:hypothetical protein n=1 Tax=Corallococcus interemptor TaxID=2316720 RepID=UPI003D04211F